MVLFHGLCLTPFLAAQGPFSVSSTHVLGRNLFPFECGVLLSPEPLTFSACCLLHPMAENLRSTLAQGLDQPLGGLPHSMGATGPRRQVPGVAHSSAEALGSV